MNTERTGYLPVSGAKIYYEAVGQGHPLILINTDKLDLRVWDQQVQYFAERFKVIRYDQVGVGRTQIEGDYPPSPQDLASQEEYLKNLASSAEEQGFPTDHSDLHALLDSLELGRVYLLGIDVGANIAIDFVLNYPSRTDALMLTSTPHVWGNEPAVESVSTENEQSPKSMEDTLAETMPFVEKLLSEQDATPLIDLMLEDPSYAPLEDSAKRRLRELLMDNSEALLVDRGRRFMPDFSTSERLSGIEVPTLVMYPEEGSLLVRETALMLEREVPGAQIVTFPGASRFVNMDYPKGFNQTVVNFLESLPGT